MKYDEMSEASLDYARKRLEQREKEIRQSQGYCSQCGDPAIAGTPCRKPHLEHYWDGCRHLVLVHRKENCKGPCAPDSNVPNCVIHNPSAHKMATWPTNWRWDRYMMERMCPHGIGHPDPDDRAYMRSIGANADEVHGCDGCCAEESQL